MSNHTQKTIQGLKWNLLDRLVSQGVAFIINVILARLLLPEDFGLLGMVIVVTGFAAVFKDFGLGSAIVQKKDLTEDDLSSVFWFNLLMGIALTLIIYFSAPLIGEYYGKAKIIRIAQLLSITYFIGALNIVQLSLLLRTMDFRRVFIMNALGTLISGGVAISLALLGYGVWSLVWKLIVFAIVTSIVLWIGSNWRPKIRFSTDSLHEIMGFSLPLLGTNSLNYWVRNADNLLIGKYIGDAALGFYNQSYRIMLVPVRQITGVISKVLFPSFAQIQDDRERIKAIYLRVIRILSFITFPLMFGLCALAEPFVRVILGEQWIPMVPVLRYLSIVGAFQSVGSLNGNIFQATGKTAYQFWVGLPPRILYLVAIILGLSYGIEQVALNYMLAVVVAALYMYYFVGKLINLSVATIISTLGLNFICSAIMGAITYLFYSWHNISQEVNPVLWFCISIFIGVGLYALLTFFINRKELDIVRQTIETIRRK